MNKAGSSICQELQPYCLRAWDPRPECDYSTLDIALLQDGPFFC